MKHPFETLRPEYSQLISMMQVRADHATLVDRTAKRLLGNLEHYMPVTQAIGVPAIFIATSFEREASSNFKLNPAQGWPLTSRSKWIPYNGPFPNWVLAALAAYRLNGLDKVGAGNWTWELMCFYGEMFNGFGYRDFHSMHTPYLWAWSNIQQVGKYTSDGHFDVVHFDEQMGMIPVARRMVELMPELAIGVLPQIAAPLVLQAPQHSGIADIDGGAQWVQHALNTLGFTPPLREDGNYGRMTRLAVQHFQQDYNIAVDGFAGPQTISALHLALAKKTGEPA
jgi:lysozyme family protein